MKDWSIKNLLSACTIPTLTVTFFVYLAFIPEVHIFTSLSNFDSTRVLECLLLLGITLASSLNSQFREYLFNRILIIKNFQIISLLSIFLVLGIASSFIKADKTRYALLDISILILLLYTSTFISYAVYSRKENITKYISFFLIILAIIPIWNFLTCLFYNPNVHLKETAIIAFWEYSNIRYFNQIQSWLFFLLIIPILYWKKKNNLFYFTSFGVLSFWWLLLFASECRGTLLSVFLASIIIFFTFRKNSKNIFTTQFISFATGISLYFLSIFFNFITSESSKKLALATIDTDSNGRLILWKKSLSAIAQNPFLGIGPMHYAHDVPKISSSPHNLFFQISSEWGVISACIVLLVIFIFLKRWVQQFYLHTHNQDKNLYCYPILFATFLSAFIHSFFSGIFISPNSQVILSGVVGLMFGIYNRQAEDRNNNKFISLKCKICVYSVIILSCSIVIYTLLKDTPNLKDWNTNYMTTYEDFLRPRFWAQGKFGLSSTNN